MDKHAVYTKAKQIIESATTEAELDMAISALTRMPDYLDSARIANECRDEWNKLFARYTTLEAEYEAICRNSFPEKIRELKNGIDRNSVKKSQLERLLSSFSSDKAELDNIENEIQYKKDKISSIQKEGMSLGFFAFRRRKELFVEMRAIQKEMQPLTEKAQQLKKAVGGYSSLDEIERDIIVADGDICILQNKLAEAERLASQERSLEEVKRDLLADDIFKFAFNNPNILKDLLEDSSVLDSVVKNPKYTSKLYGVSLPSDIINKLEGTEDKYYYLNRDDKRTEAQLMVDFEKYFSNSLFDEYQIVKNVDPTYFGEDPQCKPIQFLFKKDGKDVLAVAILKYTSVSHMAVRNVQYACDYKNIKYIRFIIGYPNKEHYVVRRVLEELGEIKPLV